MKRIALALLFAAAAACNRDEAARPQAAGTAEPAGDAARGRTLAAQYGCPVCHAIPGVEGAQGSLGPSLAGVGARPRISFATVPNTPGNLARFIQNPASLNPQSSMPPIGLTDVDARDIAAYLATLR